MALPVANNNRDSFLWSLYVFNVLIVTSGSSVALAALNCCSMWGASTKLAERFVDQPAEYPQIMRNGIEIAEARSSLLVLHSGVLITGFAKASHFLKHQFLDGTIFERPAKMLCAASLASCIANTTFSSIDAIIDVPTHFGGFIRKLAKGISAGTSWLLFSEVPWRRYL